VVVIASPLACSTSNASLHFTGTEGLPTPVLIRQNLMVTDIVVDGDEQGRVVVDTGSPGVFLSPTIFPRVKPSAVDTVRSLAFSHLLFQQPTVVGTDVINSTDSAAPIGGVVGCSILCNFEVSLNYRDATLTLGGTPLPADVDTLGTSLPFTLLKGVALFPPSRVLLDIVIEGGAKYTLLLDTGATFVTLQSALFDAIASDGRARLPVQEDSTKAPGSATRLQSVTLAGAQAARVVAAEDATLDAKLAAIANETGHQIDGLLGGSFLRNFFVTVDYPNRTLHLRPLLAGAPAFDYFDRVGIALAASTQDAGYVVQLVVPSTDAEQNGVAVGDSVVAVDGQELAPLGLAGATELLTGPVGSRKTVTFGAAHLAALANNTVSLRVDELLPP
jgi:hypothetical protein